MKLETHPLAGWEPSDQFDIWPGCIGCGLYQNGAVCAAYPEGIPLPIAGGMADHMVFRPGQVPEILFGLKFGEKAGEEGGETRGGTAEADWKRDWQKLLPVSAGGGRFVLHHHWRGLSEEESKLSEEQLLQTDHSLHEDLRLEGPDALWGWSAFTGTVENVRKAGGCRLCSLPADDNLQTTPKLPQPKEWLVIGKGKGYISEPGGVGSTSQSYSKFFAIDTGIYRLGVARQHLFEIFLHGNKLKGRFLAEYTPVGGRRVWLLDRPQSQESYTSAHKLEDVLQELKSKGQRYLVWGDGKGKSVLYDAETGKPVG